MAATYPPTNPKALPNLSIQVCWWALALSSPLAIIIGAIAYYRIREAKRRVTGGPYALAAVVVGGAGTLGLVVTTGELTGQRKANRHGNYSCSTNLKQLELGMMMYSQDYDEHYPPSASWNALTMPYIKNESVYRCPDEEVDKVPSFGMNRRLDAMFLAKVAEPAEAVSLFDSLPGANRVGGKELLPHPSRHYNGQNIGYVDGHVKFILDTKIDGLQWTVKIGADAKPEKDKAASQEGPVDTSRKNRSQESGQAGEKK